MSVAFVLSARACTLFEAELPKALSILEDSPQHREGLC